MNKPDAIIIADYCVVNITALALGKLTRNVTNWRLSNTL